MRQPQQQNRRGRGRGGRKPQNPLQRGYESNGPDVKIRGNASHIAEKYITLARDALSSGETILAENYLQHAEHYNRIIAAAQPAQQNDQQGQNMQNGHVQGQVQGPTQGQGQANDNRGEGRQQNRNRRNAPESEQAVEKTADAAVAEPAEKPAAAQGAAVEDAPKPRRRRAPRAKTTDDGGEAKAKAKPGPVRMGDMPADETAG